MKMPIFILASAMSAVTGMAFAAGPYDLLFRQGTLDDIAPGTEIIYDQSGAGVAEAAEVLADLDLRLSVHDAQESYLELFDTDRFRRLGTFPTAVGNPLLMYFFETTIRDVAQLSGGSPFYMRNRFKEALLAEATPDTVTRDFDGTEVSTKEITLHPFQGDINSAKMGGFEDLALTISVSDAVPGWYQSLAAVSAGGDGYDYRVTVVGTEPAEGTDPAQ